MMSLTRCDEAEGRVGILIDALCDHVLGYRCLAVNCPANAPALAAPEFVLDSARVSYNPMVVSLLDATFAALCDPTRRKIVDQLSQGETPISDLSKPSGMSQQAFSKHLSYLERSRLISRRKLGRQVYCALNPHVIREVAIWADKYRAHWNPGFKTSKRQ